MIDRAVVVRLDLTPPQIEVYHSGLKRRVMRNLELDRFPRRYLDDSKTETTMPRYTPELYDGEEWMEYTEGSEIWSRR